MLSERLEIRVSKKMKSEIEEFSVKGKQSEFIRNAIEQLILYKKARRQIIRARRPE